MIKLIVLIGIVGLAIADNVTLENCKCWKEYEAKETDGKIQCQGIRLRIHRPCNLPEPPKCECNEEVTSVTTDSTGTWCTVNANGNLVKKWPCENKDEWNVYKAKMEAFEKTIVA